MLNIKTKKPEFITGSQSNKRYKRNQYLKFNLNFLGTTLSFTLLIGLFNYIVDPYGIFQTVTLPQFNLVKPVQDKQIRIVKAAEIIQLKPKRIMLGSSRTLLGLNPQSDIFNKDLVTYNAALMGAHIKDTTEYLEHTLVNQPDLKEVILGLDFFMFNDIPYKNQKNRASILGQNQIPVSEFIKLNLSVDALNYSKETLETNIKSNQMVKPSYFYGMRNTDDFKKDVYQNFDFQINYYFKIGYSNYRLSQEALAELRKIVRLCQERNIKLKVFISPVHATQMEIANQLGLWNEYENWKREVVKIVPVWDFATYNQVTTEPISNKMKNFYDNSHYTKEIGDLVLNRIFAYQEEKLPQDFGTFISSQNIEPHLEKTRLDKERWIASHPQEVKMVRDIHEAIMKK